MALLNQVGRLIRVGTPQEVVNPAPISTGTEKVVSELSIRQTRNEVQDLVKGPR